MEPKITKVAQNVFNYVEYTNSVHSEETTILNYAYNYLDKLSNVLFYSRKTVIRGYKADIFIEET